MTIDSNYSIEARAIVPDQEYVFDFEHIGEDTITVFEIDRDGNYVEISSTAYTVTSTGSAPVFEGGIVQFTVPHRDTTEFVSITRNTPDTQLVDYQPYTPFPAEVNEFALDKLTLIAQEHDARIQFLNDLIAAGDGPGGGEPPTPGPGEYVRISGDTMTGQLDFITPSTRRKRMETIEEITFNGMRIYSTNGRDAEILIYSDAETGNVLMNRGGLFGFFDALPDQGAYRYIVQAINGTERKMVLGSPWPNSPETDGYNHLQLYFERDADTETPFFVAQSNGRLQAAIGGEGGAIFSDNVEIRDYQDTNTFTYSLVSSTDTEIVAGTEGVGILQPVRSLEDPDNPRWYSSEFWIVTNNTPDSTAGINTFKFDNQGHFVCPRHIYINNPSYGLWWGTTIGDFTTGIFRTSLGDDRLIIRNDAGGGIEFDAADTSGYVPWRMQANGDFVAPGDIIIDSAGNNSGALEIRNFEQSGAVGWYSFFVSNTAGLDASLIIEPANETGAGTGRYYSGDVRIAVNSTSGGTAGVKVWHFRSDGTINSPTDADIIMNKSDGTEVRLMAKIAELEARLAAAGF